MEILDCVRDVLAPDAVATEANRVAVARKKDANAEVSIRRHTEGDQPKPTPSGLGFSLTHPTALKSNATDLPPLARNEASPNKT